GIVVHSKTQRCITQGSFVSRLGFLMPTTWRCGDSVCRMTYWPSEFRLRESSGTVYRVQADNEGVWSGEVQRVALVDRRSFIWSIDGSLYREGRCRGVVVLRHLETSRIAVAFADGCRLLGKSE